MKAKKITLYGILAAMTGLIGLEVWTLFNKQKEDTISEVIHAKSKEWLLIPFLFGALMAHWYWPLTRKK